MSKTKVEFIKSMKNVKIIIGNGFDLHCKLKTSYKDYFIHDEYKNEYLEKLLNNFLSKLDNYISFNNNDYKESWVQFENFDKINVWDFFFYINSDANYGSTKEWKWCDIENMICSWLKARKKTLIDDGKPYFEIVYNIINNNGKSDNERIKLMAAVVYKKHNENRFKSKEDFYTFLLDELELFERNFGLYIVNLHYERNEAYGFVRPKTRFLEYASETIDKLCNFENIVSIDSFNYDDLEDKELNEKLFNINGNVESPIFGIDSNEFEASDIRYIFSKTNRRMELDMLSDDERKNIPFKNVIIYGHSLDEADYSYFFSVFDKLKVIDLDNDSKIVFAFSIYETEKKQQIRAELRSAISKMFSNYSIYLGKDKHPNRLLDVLTTQGKILLYEVH